MTTPTQDVDEQTSWMRVKETDHIGALIELAAQRFGDRTFLQFDTSEISFADMDRKSAQVANGLSELGIRNGDRVAIMLDNCPEYVISWFGISRLGAVEVSLNTAFKGVILRYILENSGTAAVILDAKYLPVVEAERPALPSLKRLIVVNGTDGNAPTAASRYEEFSASATSFVSTVTPVDVAMLGYTSGTTGPSKGAMVPHNRIVKTAEDVVGFRNIGTQDNLYTCLPLFHGNAKYHTVMPALVAGCRMTLGRRFSASQFWDEVRNCGATQFNYLGVMIAILHKREPSPADTNHCLRLGWGAGAPRQIAEDFERRFGVRLIEGYGLTEGGVPLSNTLTERRLGSCGKPVRGYEVDVVDDWDNPVPPDVEGELIIRSKRPFTTMLGYFGMPEKTVEIFRNGWLHTGDLARKDKDGFFYFVDRKKDAIRRRGENISTFEVEAAINTHPYVRESAVFAAPSDVSEDDVMAIVVLRDGANLSEAAFIEHCEANMPYFWVPRYVRFTHADLPRTPTNKVEKYKLRQQGITADTWDRQKAGGAAPSAQAAGTHNERSSPRQQDKGKTA